MTKRKETKFKQTEIGMIPEDWEVSVFNDIAEIDPKRELKKGEKAKYVGMEDIKPFTRKISNFQIKEFKGGSKFKNNDILFARITPCLENGKTAFVNVFEQDEIGFGSTEFIVFSSKNGITDPMFIYYLLISSEVRNIAIKSMTGTSGRQRVEKEVFKSILVPFPPLSEQRAIAKILSDLDSKIELNQQMNKTLEAIGQAIFKHWFIDFEFPNEEGKPYKSSGGEMVYNEELGKEIPKGWKVGKLGDGVLTNILSTGIIEFEGEKIYLDTSSVQNSEIIDMGTNIKFNERPSRANMQPEANTVWFARMKNSKKTMFFDDYSSYAINNFILSTGFAGLGVKKHALYYIWSFVLRGEFELTKDNLCNGTTMQAINNKNIKKIRVLVPPDPLLEKFNFVIKPIYERTYYNWLKRLYLSQIRDSLLPKLMTGKIRVPLEDVDNEEIEK
ncbi:MAG: restriction endonuclease subunit S [archaeon]